LKFDSVIVRDAEGERRLTPDQLPIRLGTGNDCEIRLPGPGNAPVAAVDDLDGEPFVQPLGRNAALNLNGKVLKTAQRLAAGDELEFFGTRIVVGEQAGSMSLQVLLEDSAYVTKPPELPASDDAAGDETIAPLAFRRAAEVTAAATISKPHRWQYFVGAGMAILVVLSWLLFSSRSIQFDVRPGGADEFSISGGWFRLPIGDRILMREGSYTVHVGKLGYYDVSQELLVDETPSRTVVIELRKLPGKLTVYADSVADAVVTVNDTKVGQSPFGPLELEPGTHSISVSADRYLPFADRLQVPGLGRHQYYHVQLVPQWANVDISSEPSGATVFEGQKKVGVTPLRLELMEGTHMLSVVADGFKAWDGSIETVSNRDQVLPVIQLEPANAQLQVNSIPRGANVTVNGRYRGQSPITLALSPGIDYQIGLSKAGYGATERRIRLKAAASESITIDLSARVGKVTLTIIPPEATVYVDGTARGAGSMTMNLSSAPHQLEVRREGYQSFSRSITPRPGYPQSIQIRLLSDAEVLARGTANAVTTSDGQAMRRIEPGGFMMGTSRREQGRRANEVLVPVTLTKAFYIGTREVTNRDYHKFRKNHISGQNIHPSLAGDMNPVVNVSWAAAVEYCNWLSIEEGLPVAYAKKFQKWQPITPTPGGYRLPTEAEWAWAIRYQGRSQSSIFPWGSRLPPRNDSGNYADRAAIELVPSILPNYEDGFASTAPAGSFPANALGLHDGGGNVAEWVQDYYSVPNPGQTEPVVDPAGATRGNNRVIRGSSWRHAGVAELRLGYRDYGTGGRADVGFRIAKNAD
jgi:formylglycine-generating enzyme required for sulfatase activity